MANSLTKNVTCHGGPWSGKTFSVHVANDRIQVPGVADGHYSVGEVRATWKRTPRTTTPAADTPPAETPPHA